MSRMATIPCFQVDAFTDRLFSGNPAAVCLLDTSRPAKWMQSVATENNLSETAFIVPLKTGFRLRWFTLEVEVALCGHATLASAHVLWSEGLAPRDMQLTFKTKSGLLSAVCREQGIELNFPSSPAKKGGAAAALKKALGVKPLNVVKAADDLLVEVASESVVRKLQPDLSLLKKIKVLNSDKLEEIVVYDCGGQKNHEVIVVWKHRQTARAYVRRSLESAHESAVERPQLRGAVVRGAGEIIRRLLGFFFLTRH